MRVTTTVEAFRTALSNSRAVIAARPTLLARAAVLIVASGERTPVRVVGSSDHISVVSIVEDAKIEEKGSALVLPTQLAAYLNALDAEDSLVLETTDTHLTVTRDGGTRYAFTLVKDQYPDPVTPKGSRASVAFEHLANAVSAVKRTVGENGLVRFTSETGGAVMIDATDNFRLTRAVIPGAGFGDFEGVFPLTALDRIARAMPTVVNFDKKAVNAASGHQSITVRAAADNELPDMGPALSATPANTLTFHREDALKAVSRLHAAGGDSIVTIALDATSMSLVLINSALGRGSEDIPLEGGPTSTFTFSVNLKFLLDAIQSHYAPELTLGFTGPTDMFFLRSHGPIEVTSIVMPVAGKA